MSILHIHRNQVLFLERARVSVIDDRVVYSQANNAVTKSWNVPQNNLSCLILGTGCSISTAATRLLSDSMTYVMHSGSGGSPIYMTSLIDYRPTKIFQKWVMFWPNPDARLIVAKFLATQRCENFLTCPEKYPQFSLIRKAEIRNIVNQFINGIQKSETIYELTGYEGYFSKQLYAKMANACNFVWDKRDNSSNRDNKSVVDKLLDDSNYILYGMSALAIFLMGLVPQMPVTHGKTRAGGLVFDFSDVFKDSISLTCAFSSYEEGMKSGSDYRQKIIRWCDDNNLLKRNINIIHEATDLGFRYINGNEELLYDKNPEIKELNNNVDLMVGYDNDLKELPIR